MAKKIYLVPLKSALDRSISHYFFAINPVAVFNIRRIHLNFQFFKDFQNSAFQSVIITCFGNTGQFQALTPGGLTITPA